MTSAHAGSGRALLIATAIGLLVYAAGVALAGFGAIGAATRVAAILLLLWVTVRRRTLTAWTFFAILAGAELGADAPVVAVHFHVLAEIFLRLVRVIVAPLILGTLTTGIAAHGQVKSLGRVALKTLVYFEVVTTLALLLGVVAIDLSRAGEGVVVPAALLAQETPATVGAHTGFESFLLNVFPENLVTAIGDNQILQVAVFAILFGVALALLSEEKRAPLLGVLESLTAAMFQVTKIIMYLAPIAAGAALSYTVGSMGISTLVPLAKLVATFYGAALALVVLVFVPVLMVMRIPVRGFLEAVSEPAAIGFATSTSQSALPLAMERMEEFGVPRWVVSFVIPSGYSFNMDGASLYLSIASIFAAQVAGIHLSVGQQAVMVFTLMLTSKGIAGVPRATLMILLATAASFHLPSAPILMILGVDALIDMGRTALNVTGNCLAAAVVGKWEGLRSE
ncbi:dicarboxylate/amino acid:cation symporter [Acidicapsa acidisoli]|uniref:dicarboxylate/amino acid:cation symporter n=1 Tax=Acidicapsa acidisoli TaxID=1615681 RepID=UPI0021E0AC44|nr:cation:dicarboxylase symporter family transporter [Acidicapsa acidisoli]